MRTKLAACLCVALAGACPGYAQTAPAPPAEEPVEVPPDAPKGSSGPGSVSLTLGSGTLVIVGLVAVVTLGAIAALAND